MTDSIHVAIAERTLPFNLEAERSVLGAVLLHGEVFHLVASSLTGNEFFRDAHRRIFDKMAILTAHGLPIDMVLLKEELARTGDLDEVGGPSYLASLVDGIPRGTNIEYYAAIISDKARLRGLIFAANKLLGQAYEAEEPAAQVVESGVQALLGLGHTDGGQAVQIGQAALAYAVSLDNAPTANQTLPTGYVDLDEMLGGGLRPSELIVLAGRPSMGKSALGLGMSLGVAKATQAPAVFFPLETSTRSNVVRALSWTARVDKQRMTGRFLGERDYERIAAACTKLADVPVYLQDTAATLTEIAAWCQRLKAEHNGLVCAVVDYLQLLAPTHRSASRERDVALISSGLKQLAKTQGLAVVAISALNRSPEGRKDKRPQLSDLRESGSIESDADVVLLLHRQEVYDQTDENHGIAEVIVAKNREGATGVVKLVFIAEFGGLLSNLARGTPASVGV